MSVGRCIPELLAEGKLDKDQADRARELYDGHAAELGQSMSPFAAEAVASKVAVWPVMITDGMALSVACDGPTSTWVDAMSVPPPRDPVTRTRIV